MLFSVIQLAESDVRLTCFIFHILQHKIRPIHQHLCVSEAKKLSLPIPPTLSMRSNKQMKCPVECQQRSGRKAVVRDRTSLTTLQV